MYITLMIVPHIDMRTSVTEYRFTDCARAAMDMIDNELFFYRVVWIGNFELFVDIQHHPRGAKKERD